MVMGFVCSECGQGTMGYSGKCCFGVMYCESYDVCDFVVLSVVEVCADYGGKDTSVGTSYRPISLLCPAANVLESLILPTINTYLQPAPDQHGFRPDHSTTSALLQTATYIAMGFNQRKPPDRTICIAVDLLSAFDTVYHNNRLSKINRSQLPPATARWLSSYLRRQANTCFRGVKSTSRKVNTGVLQGFKLSRHFSASTLLICRNRQIRSNGST